jgi:hypothetical protein
MSEAEGEKLENDEKIDSRAYERSEIADDKIHDKNKSNDREAQEIGADVIHENIAIEYSNFHTLTGLSPRIVQQE